MSNPETVLPSDQVEGAPHPRETQKLVGQERGEQQFLEVFETGRLHHSWMISGPRGIGKATLAWTLARFLLATPDPNQGGGLFGDTHVSPRTLDIAQDHPVARRVIAGAEPGIFALHRSYDEKRKRHKQVITVDEVRKLKSFFSLTATDGGRRIAIVDSADELNTNAANALLKILEEPPENALLLLISHQPSRLLPTVRSRCRELRLAQLSPGSVARAVQQAGIEIPKQQQQALASLASGSTGEAIRLLQLGGLDVYQSLIDVITSLPKLDQDRAMVISDQYAGKGNSEEYELFLSLCELMLVRLSRFGALHKEAQAEAAKGELEVFSKLCPTPLAAKRWAQVAQIISERLRHGRSVNIDPAALILDMFFKIEECALRLHAC
ncbi:MAG: DNA polymerase III subunit delta' [Paracoccaceae bacterium]|nr:DNA polymerase III subunit delta' [Paracoccaceae bacterium]